MRLAHADMHVECVFMCLYVGVPVDISVHGLFLESVSIGQHHNACAAE